MSDRLAALGWSPYWADAFHEADDPGGVPARLLIEYQDRVRVGTADGDLEATLSGKLRDVTDRLDRPAVGDWVVVQPASEGSAVITRLLRRRTAMIRKAAGQKDIPQIVAANVDRVFVVTSMNREFNPRRLERYVAAVHDGGAEPYLVLNKADLAEADAFVDALDSAMRTLPLVVTSAVSGAGLDALRAALEPGLTVAFVGSSGVGKSSLINRLLESDALATAEVRATDDRGRHTTRNRTLMTLPSGAILIDTPGMRELHLWVDDLDGVEDSFPEVVEAAEDCRFRDCGHDTEPGCAVQAAVAEGRLDAARVASFRKLVAEAEERERR